MPLKWQSLSQDSDTAQQPSPPYGAPEGHFPDQLNNIQREGLAAIAEVGSAVFGGTDVNGASTTAPGLSDSFKQLVYDVAWPVGTMMMWDSASGANPVTGHVPSGVTATWQICDGTGGTVNLVDKIIGGANGTTSYTGTTSGSASSGAGGDHDHGGSTGSYTLLVADIPAHTHTITDPGHTHSYSKPNQSFGFNAAGGGNLQLNPASNTTGSSTTGITINSTGGGGGHSHTVSASGTHTHTVDPARTLVEIYKRTA